MDIEKEKFLEIIDTTPLVSIDLIVENGKNQFLVGKRNNKPAKDYWFVPGGRIRKNERLEDAFTRISETEFGVAFDITSAKLLGAYDHIYQDNFHGKPGVNTHYVALGYQVMLPENVGVKLDDQHAEFDWRKKDELLDSKNVHQNTKNYFL